MQAIEDLKWLGGVIVENIVVKEHIELDISANNRFEKRKRIIFI